MYYRDMHNLIDYCYEKIIKVISWLVNLLIIMNWIIIIKIVINWIDYHWCIIGIRCIMSKPWQGAHDPVHRWTEWISAKMLKILPNWREKVKTFSNWWNECEALATVTDLGYTDQSRHWRESVAEACLTWCLTNCRATCYFVPVCALSLASVFTHQHNNQSQSHSI